MRKPLEPDDIAKFIKASGVGSPVRVVIDQGFFFYAEFVKGAPHPPMKVTVDPPKRVPAKKPKKPAAPRAKRLKNPAIRKDGVILLKDRERETGRAEL